MGCICQCLLVPLLETDLSLPDGSVEPSQVHPRLDNTTQDAGKALGSLTQTKGKPGTEVCSAGACSSGWEL